METHYRVTFTGTDPEDGEEKNNLFFIDKVEVDIIYGSFNDQVCDDNDHDFSVKTSLIFVESDISRIQYGAPGYLTN